MPNANALHGQYPVMRHAHEKVNWRSVDSMGTVSMNPPCTGVARVGESGEKLPCAEVAQVAVAAAAVQSALQVPPPPLPSQPRAHPCHPPRVPPEGERCCAVRDRHPPLSCTRATQPHPRSPFPGFVPLPHRHIPRAYSWPCRCAKGQAVASVSTQGTPRVGGPECC